MKTCSKLLLFLGSTSGNISKKEQITLQETLDLTKKWTIDNPKAKLIHMKIAEMIAVDNQPFSMVEDLGFTRLMKELRTNYQIPSRKYFSTEIIPSIYERVRDKVKDMISNSNYVSFTTDIWTSNSNSSFMCLTAHCMTNFDPSVCILRVMSFEGHHTSENIADHLKSIVDEYSIPRSKIHVFVRDNGANIVKGINNAGYDSISCYLHTLQLIIKDSIFEQRIIKDLISNCKQIVGHFKHSALAYSKLRKLQDECSLPKHKLIQDVSTRWNSTYLMLERILEQKRAVTLYCTESTNLPILDGNKWSLIPKITIILKLFHDITLKLGKQYALASEIIPQSIFLRHYINKASTDSRFSGLGSTIETLKLAIKNRFQRYFEDYNVVISMTLDPRFKQNLLDDECNISKEESEKQIIKSFKAITSVDEELDTANQPSTSNILEDPLISNVTNEIEEETTFVEDYEFNKCFSELMEQKTLKTAASKNQEITRTTDSSLEYSIKLELKEYLTIPVINRDENPLTWWKSHAERFPLLSKLAKKYLSAPPSSIESERIFSIGGNIYTDKRSRLNDNTGEMLIFTNFNLRIFDFEY